LPAPSDGVAVVLTGAPVAVDGAVEWCPWQVASNDCPGIPVTGLPAAAIDTFDRAQIWQVEGVYDGVTVDATGAPEPVEHVEPDFTTPRENLRGLSSEIERSALSWRRWSGCRDLNPGSPVPQTGALDQTGPHPVEA
jgi:hypothetical protein